jgi:hypothetical protein
MKPKAYVMLKTRVVVIVTRAMVGLFLFALSVMYILRSMLIPSALRRNDAK